MKRVYLLIPAMIGLIFLTGCDPSDTSRTFSELAFSTVSYDSGAPALKYTGSNENGTAAVTIYFYDTSGTPPAEGDYTFVLEPGALGSNGEAYFAYSYLSGNDYYYVVARSGSITVSGGTAISFTDVVFDVLCYDSTTGALKSDDGTVTESGTLTIE